MSPAWRPEDNKSLVEARRIQRVLAETTSRLTMITQELNELLSEISADDEECDDDR